MTSTVKKTTKPKVAPTHPKYNEMVKAAITALKERSGSSRIAIFKYILANYNVGSEEKKINSHLKLSLKSGVEKGSLKQVKGIGASGSFKLGAVVKPVKKVVKKPVAKKVVKKTTTKKVVKKTGDKKVTKKTVAKKTAVKKAPAKKAATKATPKKAAKKPVAKKTVAKKTAAKKTTKA